MLKTVGTDADRSAVPFIADFRPIFEAVAQPLAVLDRDGRHLAANPAYADRLNCRAEDLTGRRLTALVDADDRPSLNRLLSGEAPATLATRLADATRPNGPGEAEVRLALRPLADGAGDLSRWLVELAEDEGPAAAALLRERERMRHLLALGQMAGRAEREVAAFALERAIELTGSTIGYLHFYDEATRILDLFMWSDGTLRQCRVAEASHCPLDQAGLWADCLRQRQPVILNDYQALSRPRAMPQGHVRILRHLGVPVFDIADRIVAIIGVGNKPAPYEPSDSEELELFAGSLWKIIVRDRMEREMIAARDAAEAADHAKSAFIASMSHELRTPLNAIIGFAEFIELGLFGPLDNRRYRECAADIHNAGRYLLGIIEDRLDLVRIEKGRVSLIESEFDLSTLSIELGRMTKARVNAKSITVDWAMPSTLPSLYGDKRLIKQVVLNLVLHAVKLAPEGGLVEVVGQEVGEEMLISVACCGVSLDERDLATVMAPDGEDAEDDETDGEPPGLSLPIVKSLVELHDGRLEVETSPTIGTTVRVWLPAERLRPKALPAGTRLSR